MKKILFILFISLGITGITACGDSPKASLTTVNDNQLIAKANAKYLAKTFVAERIDLQGMKIIMQGDSTISSRCPGGDGWASITLVKPGTNINVKVKCSTYSTGLGCMLQTDFDKKDLYSSQDGTCNPELPDQLPKILN